MPVEPPPNSVHPKSRAQWRKWLEKHHARGEGVWLISYKKATGKPRFDYAEAVEEALCCGWIDSKPAKLDDERSMLWYAPRKKGSAWSQLNKERVARMMDLGMMMPAGLEKVRAAQADGSWSALDEVEVLLIPPDLAQALAQQPAAAENFEAFPRSAKRGILDWIRTAKTEATRAKRIAETAALAGRNERANQWRPATSRQPTS